MKLISTTALSKLKNIPVTKLFEQLEASGFIRADEKEKWILTDAGKKVGGEFKQSPKFGKYIVWPEDLDISSIASSVDKKTPSSPNEKLISSTAIGQHFNLSANKINYIFSELGWLNKGLKGWVITEQGKKQKGLQKEDHRSGIPYVLWPESILQSKPLNENANSLTGNGNSSDAEQVESQQETNSQSKDESLEFREKFEAKHRAADGHFVRSKAEMLIDNWLYMAEIVHAYERKLPIEENVYCDFYIPTGKVYIEYWGYENDSKYLYRKKQKQDIYAKYGFRLIELEEKDVQNLDDTLPKMLLKYGVQAY